MVVDESMLIRVPFCPGRSAGAWLGRLDCVVNRKRFGYLSPITPSRHSYHPHCRYGQYFVLGEYLQFAQRPNCTAVKPRLKGPFPPSDNARDLRCTTVSFDLPSH